MLFFAKNRSFQRFFVQSATRDAGHCLSLPTASFIRIKVVNNSKHHDGCLPRERRTTKAALQRKPFRVHIKNTRILKRPWFAELTITIIARTCRALCTKLAGLG
uniref:Uncharacterized protein n=1 Tax=Caulerpa lentillifera TaxID=148947 RepID=A0A2Z2QLJ2_9CHLO|nr:hypothetical protein [Caulerpa lentillifera]AST24265.1 hypothetical protein [Caulerpa lentillifera]